MRYECDFPGYEDCFIEVSESWTRSEIRRFYADGDKPEWFEMIKSKIVSINLRTSTGVIDSPEKFVESEVDDMDYQIWQWVSAALIKAHVDVRKLGEAPALRWYEKQGAPATAPNNSTKK